MPLAAWSFDSTAEGWAGFANVPAVVQGAVPSLDGGALQITPSTALWSVNRLSGSIAGLFTAVRGVSVSAWLYSAAGPSTVFFRGVWFTAGGSTVGTGEEAALGDVTIPQGVWTRVGGVILVPPAAGAAPQLELRIGSTAQAGAHALDLVAINAVASGRPRTGSGGPARIRVGATYLAT
jgi:hypothetical protein